MFTVEHTISVVVSNVLLLTLWRGDKGKRRWERRGKRGIGEGKKERFEF